MKPNMRFGIVKRRSEPLDWKKLDSIAIEEILRDPETPLLTEVLPQIAFCDPQVEFCDQQKGTAGLQKVFRLSQLMLEKLVTKEEEWKEERLAVELKCQALADENSRHVRGMKRMSRRLRIANQELKKREEMLVEVEKKAKENRNPKNRISKCPYCSKTFQTRSYLRAHLARRHAGSSTQLGNPSLTEFDDIKQILQMKEELDNQWKGLTPNISHLKTPKPSLQPALDLVQSWEDLEAVEKGLESQQAFWKSKLESNKPSETIKQSQSGISSDIEWKTRVVWKDVEWIQYEWAVCQWKEVNWTTWAFRSNR